ncbi:MAG: recombinase family protein [Christensenellaceae bacterium]|jgi:DNA invertase Pin-like site-specific DNA recombinase|nr:recombinase family protein [Christensenellaceae bacterium]
MIYGYIRIRSKFETISKSFDKQCDRLKNEGHVDEIHADIYVVSSEATPKFDKLLTILKPGDTLVVTDMFRLARNEGDALTLIRSLIVKGILVRVLGLGDFDMRLLSPELLDGVIKSAAEYREIKKNSILEYIMTKIELDPEWKDGRPGKEFPDFPKYYNLVKAKKMTMKKALEELGMCNSIWYKRVKEIEANAAESKEEEKGE